MNKILKRISLFTFIIAFGNNLIVQAAYTVSQRQAFGADKSAWRFKRQIILINNGEKVANAVVKIQLSSTNFDYLHTKSNGADIRFSLKKTLIGAGMAYWIETWNEDGNTTIWLKIPLLNNHEKITLYMFYGNAAAEAASNGDNTFLFFDDFESGNYARKWINVSIGQVEERDHLLKLRETDGEEGIIEAKFKITGKMIIRTLYQRDHADEHWTRAGIGGWNYFLCFGDHTNFAGTGTNYVMIYDNNSLGNLKSAPLTKKANKVITDKWRPAALWYDGKNLNGIQDNVTVSWPVANLSSKLLLRTLDNDAWDNFAFVTVSSFSNGEQQLTIGIEEKN